MQLDEKHLTNFSFNFHKLVIWLIWHGIIYKL